MAFTARPEQVARPSQAFQPPINRGGSVNHSSTPKRTKLDLVQVARQARLVLQRPLTTPVTRSELNTGERFRSSACAHQHPEASTVALSTVAVEVVDPEDLADGSPVKRIHSDLESRLRPGQDLAKEATLL